MKPVITTLTAILLTLGIFCQSPGVDSLKARLNKTMPDTARVNLLVQIADSLFHKYNTTDSYYWYGTKAIRLARQINWKLGEAKGIWCTPGYTFFIERNYVKCLSDCLFCLSVFEEARDTSYIVQVLSGLAAFYRFIGDFPQVINYCRKLLEIAKIKGDQYAEWDATYNIGESYFWMVNGDSAAYHYQHAYFLSRAFVETNDYINLKSFVGLARGAILQNESELAETYLKKAAPDAVSLKGHQDFDNILGSFHETYADLYSGRKQWDSALNSLKLAGTSTSENRAQSMLDYYYYIRLASVYEHIDKDSSNANYKKAHELRSSFDSKTRSEILTASQNEVQRQQERRRIEAEEKISRRRNIQFLAMSIIVVSIIILYLLYSRSIIASSKLMRFLGVIVLLIVFEFINLIIHPYISHYTGDSPMLMLLIMVSIAAVLIPAHHRIEHWVSHQLIEKNKRIRLEAAKKTIKQLEG